MSIRPAFLLPDREFEKLAEMWVARILDARIQLLVAAPIIVAVWIVIVVSEQRGFNPWFPTEWFEQPFLWGKILILWMYTVAVAVLSVSPAVGMLIYCLFAIELSRKPLVPVLGFVKFKLRPIADFAFPCWFSWSFGVALFVLLFRPGFNAYNIVVVGLLTAIGFVMLLVPQYALYSAFKRTKDTILAHGWQELLRQTHDARHAPRVPSDPNHLRMHGFLHAVATTKAWPNDLNDALLLLGTWLIPIAVLAIQSTVHLVP